MIDLAELPNGWKYGRDRWMAMKGRTTIYENREIGGYSISEHQGWIPGHYETLAAAVAAFRFPDAELAAIQDRKNAENGGMDGVITLADLVSPTPSEDQKRDAP